LELVGCAHRRGRGSIRERSWLAPMLGPFLRHSKAGCGKPFFFESFCQGGNRNPRGLMSFFYFRGPQACACHLIDQIPEHNCRGLILRQTGLAQHLQRVSGLRKIRVVALGRLAGCPHKARRPIKFRTCGRDPVSSTLIDPAPACAVPNAAGLSVLEPPIPGDCQGREQQQGNNFFWV
jgi:hypothetical protein